MSPNELVSWFFENQTLVIIAALAFIQNIAFTFVSRGRNSGSLPYHAIASIFSNGIWLALFYFNWQEISDGLSFGALALAYVPFTVAGSVFAHYLAKRFEKGRGRVNLHNEVESLRSAITQLQDKYDANKKEIREAQDRLFYLTMGTDACVRAMRLGDQLVEDKINKALNAKKSKSPTHRQPRMRHKTPKQQRKAISGKRTRRLQVKRPRNPEFRWAGNDRDYKHKRDLYNAERYLSDSYFTGKYVGQYARF